MPDADCGSVRALSSISFTSLHGSPYVAKRICSALTAAGLSVGTCASLSFDNPRYTISNSTFDVKSIATRILTMANFLSVAKSVYLMIVSGQRTITVY
jgi:hypothetical protein